MFNSTVRQPHTPNNHEILKARYVNQRLEQIQAPAAVVDEAVVKKNCRLMLETASKLGVQFRAHVKTHKTIEGAKLQVGDQGPIRLIVSTIPELEHMLPWLQSEIQNGRSPINILYGLPVGPSQLTRLAKISHILGGYKYISVLVDHPDTLDFINQSYSQWASGGPINVFIKIDTGYHRAGVLPDSKQLQNICSKLADPAFLAHVKVVGLYSHLGHSYGFDKPEQSLEGLITEFETLVSVTKKFSEAFPASVALSVGATPTTTAAQALASANNDIIQRWDAIRSSGHAMELHAGVYPFLDLQQLATHARASNLDYKNIGLRILAEVVSLYPERSPPEALVAAGSLALGREPCKSYSGWGVVSPWRVEGHSSGNHYSEEQKTGWIVGSISQEHGILKWQGDQSKLEELKIGQKLLIWPNHACIAGVGYELYLVVDSESGDGEMVKDIWIRCRGW